ncbi:ribonuclease III [Viridothelium virens]|uniref:Ribonuclease III n=1 Tax=Viridothelium virens TaxID=1048519 RepID=A0A6A6H660_VIRVR|nr:ribonuclease III [Viridothelium virens]
MQNFYHPLRNVAARRVPHILGLSASPVVRASAPAKGLDTIETNLNARATTPKRYRSELLRNVYPPKFDKIVYPESASPSPPALEALRAIDLGIDLNQDPDVKELLQIGDEDSQLRLEKFRAGKKTFCSDQISTFCRSSNYIFDELGPWATNWYIWICLRNFRSLVDQQEELISSWTMEQKFYMLELLQDVQSGVQEPCKATQIEVSPKAQLLLDLLAREATPDFTGLIFVKQRATVAALAELLSIHPDVKDCYKLGTFVGSSTFGNRKFKFAERVDLREQQQSLEEFRSGRKNLLLGTSVLEEGIDVAACNSVTCFETPENLKSYIQRRGRARMKGSKYTVFLSQLDTRNGPAEWDALEEEMRKAYADELREIQVLAELEESEEDDGRFFRVEKTGALLTIDNALEHLHHFCAKLAAEAYVDPRPQFTKIDEYYDGKESVFGMEVILPPTLEPRLRTASSLKLWKSEKNARKDAAFQAYMNLYRAGLINDNLLPLEIIDPDAPTMDWTDSGPSIVSVSDLMNPWTQAVTLQRETQDWYEYLITVTTPGEQLVKIAMFLPADTGKLPDICFYWNATTRCIAQLEKKGITLIPAADSDSSRKLTKLILSSVFGTRMRHRREDFVTLFVPLEEPQKPLCDLLQDFSGKKPASPPESIDLAQCGLIREKEAEDRPLIFQGFETTYQSPDEHYDDGKQTLPESMIKYTRFPKRRDFLHPVPASATVTEAYTTVDMIPARDCTVDNLPSRYSIFALFVPAILHLCGLKLILNHLCENILHTIGFRNVSLVQAAITASSAREEADYQRLEFLGDAILKYSTSLRVFNEHPHFPEKYLTAEKGRCVSNATIANAAIEKGLDKYIITTAFTGLKWKPVYIEDTLNQQAAQRDMARKILADVVEALIGASYIDGGWLKAQACIEVFLPPNSFSASQMGRINSSPQTSSASPAALQTLEELIGYTFTKKSLLLESITHPSFTTDTYARPYDRLEFLGDAILDYIITPRLYHLQRPSPPSDAPTPLKHYEMHSLRTAIVNADFLAFCALSHSIPESRAEVVRDDSAPSGYATRQSSVDRYLWQYMRKSNPEIARAQEATVARFRQYEAEVREGLAGRGKDGGESEGERDGGERREKVYPWLTLMRIRAEKFFSDMVESVIGAIWLDSGGNLRECEGFVERLGIFGCLERLLVEGVNIMHPKERVGILAGNEKVNYDTDKEKDTYHCVLKIGAEEVARGEGQTAEIAKTDAASSAVRLLEKDIISQEHQGARTSQGIDI